MHPEVQLSKAQIGKAGELLVQMRLLLLGIESAPMSTDTGIDLVAYSPARRAPVTIQVKTNLRPKKAGGKGKMHLDWWTPDDSPAELQALVDLSGNRIWVFNNLQLQELAQQHAKGRFHIYMYTDTTHKPRKLSRKVYVHDFDEYLLTNRAETVFGA